MRHKGEGAVNGPMLSQAYVWQWAIRPERYTIGLTMSGQRSGLKTLKDGFIWILVRTLLTNLFSMKMDGAKN
jgi:hypothetical protein